MAKAINWPSAFRDEVLSEDSDTLFCAFRLGTLYYDNQFWVPGEEVDIRVNHLKVRKGVVVGELKRCTVGELTPEDFSCQKNTLQSIEAVTQYLQETYGQPVDQHTLLTVVYYKNKPLIPEEVEQPDDPHQ